MSQGVAAEKVIVMRPRTEDGEDGELGLSEREPWQRARAGLTVLQRIASMGESLVLEDGSEVVSAFGCTH